MPIEPPRHPNAFEHFSKLPRFVAFFVIFGTLGAVIGRGIDKSISLIEPKSRLAKAATFGLQLLVNAVTFYVAFKVLRIDKLFFDDWISGTFQGIIFVTVFFSMQEELFLNLKGALV